MNVKLVLINMDLSSTSDGDFFCYEPETTSAYRKSWLFLMRSFQEMGMGISKGLIKSQKALKASIFVLSGTWCEFWCGEGFVGFQREFTQIHLLMNTFHVSTNNFKPDYFDSSDSRQFVCSCQFKRANIVDWWTLNFISEKVWTFVMIQLFIFFHNQIDRKMNVNETLRPLIN